ncbi:MAG TPA: metal-dependent hydrolase, partial [Alistipes sp.]|nr:metal-dependent hydrolase [Alistipes sp.]
MACSSGDKHVDDPDGPDNPGGGDEYEDIQVVNGKVRFYLREAENSVRKAMGTGERAWSKSLVSVNGKSYAVESDENGRYYVEASASSSGTYNAILTNSGSSGWYGSSAYADVKLPYSQFWAATAASLQSYPMYGSYTKENGNKLVFDDAFAVLDLALTGSAKIASVKVENLAESPLAGYANFLPSRGYLSITGGVGFAVLNCTDNGKCVSLESGTPKHFYVMLAPGDYPSGLKITISDSEHRAMEHTLTTAQLTAGKATSVTLKYAPDSDLVFYESFDNFVWGGNIMGGQESTGYAPTAEAVTPGTGTGRDGYADSFEKVAYNNPGSAFIQSNTWDEISGKTVGTSHLMSDSYVASRNIADYTYMFRCQEYQGYLACGTGNTGRGIFQTAALKSIDGIRSVKVSFDFCYQYGSTDLLLFQVVNGGMIASASVD